MRTVGELVDALSTLDRALPLGTIGIDGGHGGPRFDFTLFDQVNVQLVRDSAGVPAQAWLLVDRTVAQQTIMNVDAVPDMIASIRNCGCAIDVPVRLKPVITMGVGCPHRDAYPGMRELAAVQPDVVYVIGEVHQPADIAELFR
jgi:hypothetical protein